MNVARVVVYRLAIDEDADSSQPIYCACQIMPGD